jgi:hypothetical protein
LNFSLSADKLLTIGGREARTDGKTFLHLVSIFDDGKRKVDVSDHRSNPEGLIR